MHEGNKSKLDGLVNFEKMRMLAAELRTVERLISQSHPGAETWGKPLKTGTLDTFPKCRFFQYQPPIVSSGETSMAKVWAASEQHRRMRCAIELIPVIMNEERFVGQSFVCEPSAAALRHLKISEPVTQKLGKGADRLLLDRSEAVLVFGPRKPVETNVEESTMDDVEPSSPGKNNEPTAVKLTLIDEELMEETETDDVAPKGKTPRESRPLSPSALSRSYGRWGKRLIGYDVITHLPLLFSRLE